MTTIEFDRTAVGVSAKADWRDSEEFAGIGHFMSTLDTHSIAQPLPEASNSGIHALRSAAAAFRSTMRYVVLEYSDACAILGSGQKSMISDFDESEYANSESYERLRSRLGA